MPKQFFFIVMLLLLSAQEMLAGYGHFIIAKIKIDNNVYYFSLENPAWRVGKDYCYYTYNWEYVGEVEQVIDDFFKNSKWDVAYKELHMINLQKIKTIKTDYSGINDIRKDTLFVLRGYVYSDEIAFDGNYEILEVYEGNNIPGYSTNINEIDNIWIEEYEIEFLFSFEKEICLNELFAIKNNLDEAGKKALKLQLEQMDNTRWKEEQANLRERNIIVFSSCSC
ncbi:MAG: hypothetical protein R2798_02640 [Chitinophagales bacterium]|nr:hypothetical protein [Bacteroidota bacterium]MCB9042227.1 hypothetical protein [Chitinophagales bacterium]